MSIAVCSVYMLLGISIGLLHKIANDVYLYFRECILKSFRGLSAKDSVSPSDERSVAAVADIIETDEALKDMLSVLIQEANFLVEDNLGLLVQEECTEDERKLFKLDSILTAIGLQGIKSLKIL